VNAPKFLNRQLTGGGGVDGGHQTLLNAEVVVNDFGQGRQAVGSAEIMKQRALKSFDGSPSLLRSYHDALETTCMEGS